MRRIISVLLALAMLFSCGMVAMAEEAATPAVGIEEMDFLARLGIMDADANPEATITRAEMAKIVMMCIGQSADLAPVDTPFTDVNSSNEYSGYIQLANSAGIMVGGGDGTFDPKGNVTYNQMVKLLTHAIGHEAFAQASGGYPGGYLITASNNEMLVGTTPSGEQAVSHAVAAILIKNALNIDIYERIAYGDSYEYVSKAGVTALTRYFDVYEFQGVITANHYASLSGASSLKEDEILLDGATILKTGETDAASYLGYLMNLYVKVDDGKKYNTIVAAYPQYNTITVVSGGDVMNETTETLLVYLDEAGEKEELKIDANADMIYNGSPKFWSAADLKNNFGDITAIDNDSDGDADVLVVYNYKNIIVNSTKDADSIVYTKDETDPAWQSLVIDAENRHIKTTFVDTDGDDVTVEDLEEWNVISVAISDDGLAMKAILSYDSIEGTIVAFDDDTITIGEDVYDYDATKVATPSTANFEREAVFYLDFAGRIAAINFDGAISGMNYGYVRAAAVSGTGFNRKAEIEMLVDDGIQIFELAKEVKFNGATVSNEAVVTDAAIQDGGVVTKQLIMYALDEEGKISKLNTATDDTANTLSQNVKDDTFTLDANLTGNDAYYYSSNSLRYFKMQYLIREKTKVFVVQNPSESIDDEDLYKVMSSTSITPDVWGRALMYDVDKDRIPGAIVLYYRDGMFSQSTGDHTTAIVTGITQALDEEGDPVKRYEIFNQSGVIRTLDLPDDQKTVTHLGSNTTDTSLLNSNGTFKELTLADIKVGDVIQYSTNKVNNKIEQIRFVARLGQLEEKENSLTNAQGKVSLGPSTDGYYAAYGIIDEVIKDGIAYKTKNTSTTPYSDVERVVPITSSTKVLHYDTTTKKLETIAKDELVAGEDVFIYRYTASTYFVVSID